MPGPETVPPELAPIQDTALWNRPDMAMMAVRVSMAKVVVLVDVPSTMTVIVGVAGSGVSMR